MRAHRAWILGAILCAFSGSARAEPAPCPDAFPGAFECRLGFEGGSLTVIAGGTHGGGASVQDWRTGGVAQLFAASFVVVDRLSGSPPPQTLLSARLDEAAHSIEVVLEEKAGPPRYRRTVSYTLSRGGSILTQDLRIEAGAIPEPLALRVYAHTDLDLDDDPNGDSAALRGPGSAFQLGGTSSATLEITAGPLPDAWQIETFPDVRNAVASGLDLPDARSGSGPDDLENAFAWDVSLAPGKSFEASLRQALGAAQTRDQQSCTHTLNRSLRQLADTQGKEIRRCLKDFAKDAPGIGSLEACLVADRGGKLARARARALHGEEKHCVERPGFGPETGDTVTSAAVAEELALVHAVFGPDLDAAIVPASAGTGARDTSKCQRSVARAVERCLSIQLREFNRCKKRGLRSHGRTDGLPDLPAIRSPDALAACLFSDPKQKIQKTCDRGLPGDRNADGIRKAIDRRCLRRGVSLPAAFPACADPGGGPEALHACLARAARCRTCRALLQADALPVDCDRLDDELANNSCPPPEP